MISNFRIVFFFISLHLLTPQIYLGIPWGGHEPLIFLSVLISPVQQTISVFENNFCYSYDDSQSLSITLGSQVTSQCWVNFQFTSLVFRIWNWGSATRYYLKNLTKRTRKTKNTFLRKTSIYLWNGQSLSFFGPVLGVRAGVCVCRAARPVERLEADLGAEEVADGLQRAAGVRGQRGVCQQVWDHTVGLTHHRDVHYHTGARRLEERKKGKVRKRKRITLCSSFLL